MNSIIEDNYELARLRIEKKDREEREKEIHDLEEKIRLGKAEWLAGVREKEYDPAFSRLLSVADWTDFEIHCLMMGYAAAVRPVCRRACEKLSYHGLCAEVLMLTYEGEISPQECYTSLDSHSLLSRFIWEWDEAPVMERRLFMKEWLVSFLVTGNLPIPLADMFERTEVKSEQSPMEIRHATRMRCPFTMEDIILPDTVRTALNNICDQVHFYDKVYREWGMDRIVSYGRGISALFSGASGTGKTMAAQVVAKSIQRPLYRVSLPSVVSKYIGETEKNLNEIFDQAGRMPIVLFFDEADVLFAKRTEIKDGNDKYSNMEAAFLLQKIEEYEGVTLLATNYRQNFDEAFSRRLKFVIDFPFPDQDGRTKIWQKSIPEKLMNDEIDTEYLGRQFELSGGHIKNIVVHAAFLTAADGRDRLTMADMVEAVRHEYAKLGKVMTRRELGEYYVEPEE